MNNFTKVLGLMLLSGVMGEALAQQTDPPAKPASAPEPAKQSKATPQSEAGEPRANTSHPATPQSEAGEPRANTSRPQTAAGRAASGSGQKAPGAADRLELGTATVTGDREQPKVMYIVPWKKSDIGDLAGKPMNSLVDEILAPVDRDVFKREVVYYKAVQADTSQNGARSRPSDQGEK
ncbi:MAG TPA: hypothetical protein VHW71_17775 [Steroidobacteraceae bacterium]|jgi:hypothetical protein|nr:hypothetical protein [Steroidobacteraceae bacterium]